MTRLARALAALIPELLSTAGFGAVVAGVAMIYVPAAVILSGMIAIAAAVVLSS